MSRHNPCQVIDEQPLPISMDPPRTAAMTPPFDELSRRDDYDQNLHGHAEGQSVPLILEETPRVESDPVAQAFLPRLTDLDPPTTAAILPPFDELRRRDDSDQNLQDPAEGPSVPLTLEETLRVEGGPLAPAVFPRFKDQVNDATLHLIAVPASYPRPYQPLDVEQQPQTLSTHATASDDNDDISNEYIPDDQNNIQLAALYADVRLLTHSFLLTSPEVLVDNSDNNNYTDDFIPAASPIDQSVLATGFAEDQFPAQATRRPAFVTVTVTKPYRDATLGITMATDGASGAVYISSFRGDSDLSRVIALSPLGVGDKILTINGRSCAGLTPHRVVQMICNASGAVTIAIENVCGDPSLVETMVEKENPKSKVGLKFNYTSLDGGFLKVSQVSHLFANSFVQVGDRVVFVNGEKPRHATDAIDIIARAPRFVSLTVESRTGVVLPADDGASMVSDEPIAPTKRKVKVKTTPESANCKCCIM